MINKCSVVVATKRPAATATVTWKWSAAVSVGPVAAMDMVAASVAWICCAWLRYDHGIYTTYTFFGGSYIYVYDYDRLRKTTSRLATSYEN